MTLSGGPPLLNPCELLPLAPGPIGPHLALARVSTLNRCAVSSNWQTSTSRSCLFSFSTSSLTSKSCTMSSRLFHFLICPSRPSVNSRTPSIILAIWAPWPAMAWSKSHLSLLSPSLNNSTSFSKQSSLEETLIPSAPLFDGSASAAPGVSFPSSPVAKQEKTKDSPLCCSSTAVTLATKCSSALAVTMLPSKTMAFISSQFFCESLPDPFRISSEHETTSALCSSFSLNLASFSTF